MFLVTNENMGLCLHILFWYQRATAGDVTECEWRKQKSAPALQQRLAYV